MKVQALQGACLSISREPRWQGRISVRCSWAWPAPLDSARGADAADAPSHGSGGLPTLKGCARAKCLANPSGPGRFPFMRRCRLLIGSLPNCVGSALPEGKSAAVAATRNTQTGSMPATAWPTEARYCFRISRNAGSSRTVTPKSWAFFSFEPVSAPATR
jgi:hypothetical protein